MEQNPQTPHPQRRGFYDWYEMMIVDHGFLRLLYHNLHEIRPGVWRSNQPTPRRIRKLARRGIRTIVNLRGPRDDGGWRLEKEACDACGITLVDFSIRSREVPTREVVREADALFAAMQYPVLFHCKSGADRAGMMMALYMLLVENATASEAARQLSLGYLHIRWSKTGLLDAFLAAYGEAETRGVKFRDWMESEFDADKITRAFHANRFASLLTDKILRRE